MGGVTLSNFSFMNNYGSRSTKDTDPERGRSNILPNPTKPLVQKS